MFITGFIENEAKCLCVYFSSLLKSRIERSTTNSIQRSKGQSWMNVITVSREKKSDIRKGYATLEFAMNRLHKNLEIRDPPTSAL